MERKSRLLVGVSALALGLVTPVARTWWVPSSGAALAGPLPTPTPGPNPTPMPTATVVLPSPSVLISMANGATEAVGGLSERGTVGSSNLHVVAGFDFGAQISWRSHLLRDHRKYVTATYFKTLHGYATTVGRVAAGRKLAQSFDGDWSCTTEPQGVNDKLWQPPSFSLKAPRLVGTATVRGRPTWNVKGAWSQQESGSVTHLMLHLYIDQSNHRYVESSETGKVTNPEGHAAHVTGLVTYWGYGGPVSGKLPSACRKKGSGKPDGTDQPVV